MSYLEKRWHLRPQRTIVLHAGLPKTGTTYIQNELFGRREQLLKNYYVLMPSIAPNLTDALCSMFHDDPMVHITNKLQGKAEADLKDSIGDYFTNIEKELDCHEWNTLLLSAEGVYNLNENEMRKLQAWGRQFGHKWKIVFCVRNPLDWVRSVIQEMVKGGDTLERLYDNLPIPLYRQRIGAAVRLFGRNAVTVYSYEDAAAHPQGVLSYFLSIIGAPMWGGEGQAPQKYQNKSMSHEAVTILSRINALLPLFKAGSSPRESRNGREALNLLDVRGQPFRLPSGVRRQVIDQVADEEQWLERNFGITYRHHPTVKVSHLRASGNRSRVSGARMSRNRKDASQLILPHPSGKIGQHHGAGFNISAEALDDIALLICDLVNGRVR